jgi:hypothetical protein
MRVKRPISYFAPHEVRRFILPIALPSICIFAGVIVENILNGGWRNSPSIAFGFGHLSALAGILEYIRPFIISI